MSQLAGPLGIVGAIVLWLVLVITGGALVYWPHMPDGFYLSSGLDPGARSALLESVYLSTVTAATLGYGDIVPVDGWLRIAAPLQSFIGFTILTGAVTWALQLYPALTRVRTLATRLSSLQRAGAHDWVREADSSAAAGLLESLATQVAQARTDFRQNSEVYFFRSTDPGSALPATLPYAGHLAEVGQRGPRSDVRAVATALACTLEQLAHELDEKFLHVGGTTDDVLRALARDHGYAPTLPTADPGP